MKLFKLLLISLPAIFLLNPVFAADELPISGYNASRDYPGAHLTPDPNTEYKVLFDLVVFDEDLDEDLDDNLWRPMLLESEYIPRYFKFFI